MAGITLAQAQAQLERYLTAEEKVLLGQQVEIDGQRLTRANLAEIQRGVSLWNSRVQALSLTAQGRRRAVTVAPGW